jgi:hypothetical protein
MARPLPNKINLAANKAVVAWQDRLARRYILCVWWGKWYFGALGGTLRNQFLHTL